MKKGPLRWDESQRPKSQGGTPRLWLNVLLHTRSMLRYCFQYCLDQHQTPARCAGHEARGGKGLGASMKIRSHFKHNVFMLDEVGNLLEHLGGTEDYLLAAELYEVCLKRWPTARIQMREGARIVYDSLRGAEV
jgi:hypothetical protein